jgi:hypothetical protein
MGSWNYDRLANSSDWEKNLEFGRYARVEIVLG